MVQRNGKAGFMGEHSMMDGMPAVGLCSHIFATTYRTLLEEEESLGNEPKSDSDIHDMLMIDSVFGGLMPKLRMSTVLDEIVTKGENDVYLEFA